MTYRIGRGADFRLLCVSLDQPDLDASDRCFSRLWLTFDCPYLVYLIIGRLRRTRH